MADSYTKLDQALKDLIEAYAELEEEMEEKFADDEDSYAHAMVETLETSVESALEEHDASTALFATLLANLTEALEQLDPSAFEDEEGGYDLEEMNVDVEEYDEDEDPDEDDLELEDEEEDDD